MVRVCWVAKRWTFIEGNEVTIESVRFYRTFEEVNVLQSASFRGINYNDNTLAIFRVIAHLSIRTVMHLMIRQGCSRVWTFSYCRRTSNVLLSY